jgi:hypothetical protein
MTQVILDASMRSKLFDLRQPLDLCDESGKIIAHVIPVLDPADYEPVPPPELTEEELRAIEQSSRWYTSEEVLKHLESL